MSVLKKASGGVCILLGISGAAALTVLLLLGISALVISGYAPETCVRGYAFGSEGIGVFLAAVLFLRLRRRQLLLVGGCIGGGMCGLMCLITVCVGGEAVANTMLLHFVSCLAATITALLTGMKKSGRRKKRR